MQPDPAHVLAINGGSSSIKVALFDIGASLRRRLFRHIDLSGQGSPDTLLFDWLEALPEFAAVRAVGHRLVHGLQQREPAVVTPLLLRELRDLEPMDPQHLPMQIALLEAFRQRHPQLPQTACFDTAFHRGMPRVATLLAVPRRLQQHGVQRYGFHGLSYAYLMDELARLGDPSATRGRVILAHLGNGASMAAVRDGRGIDTSMGFTPASGLPMGTRSGDLDPGLPGFLARNEQMTPAQFDHMANHESGLLGVSGTSADVRELLRREAGDPHAAEALALFCYQAKKLIGAYAAALGGLDTLVFSGGIGEHAPQIRARICTGLGFLGITIDHDRNAGNAGVISTDAAAVTVRVIATDEELMIARACVALITPP